MAGLYPAGVICEILDDDGKMMRRPQLEEFSAEHGLTFVTVAQLVAYRLQHERLVHRVANARLPTQFGEFRVIGYSNDVDDAVHELRAAFSSESVKRRRVSISLVWRGSTPRG